MRPRRRNALRLKSGDCRSCTSCRPRALTRARTRAADSEAFNDESLLRKHGASIGGEQYILLRVDDCMMNLKRGLGGAIVRPAHTHEHEHAHPHDVSAVLTPVIGVTSCAQRV